MDDEIKLPAKDGLNAPTKDEFSRWEVSFCTSWSEAQALSIKGWELVCVVPDPPPHIFMTYYFKRPLDDY